MKYSFYCKRLILLLILSAPLAVFAGGFSSDSLSGGGKFSVGLQAGTSGVGANLSMAVLPSLNLRVGGTYAEINNYPFKEKKSSIDVANSASATVGYLGVFADWHPFKGATGLNITIGVLHSFIGGTLNQQFTYNSGSTSEDLGTLKMSSIKVNQICPYAGLTLGNPIPKKKISFSAEIGTYYFGSPTFTWTGIGAIAPTADQRSIVEGNIKDYSFYPVVTLQLNYKIN